MHSYNISIYITVLLTFFFLTASFLLILGKSKPVPLELLSPLRQRFCIKDEKNIIQNNYSMKDLPVSVEDSKETNLLSKR